jgi:thioesterase domain-containing protein
MHTSSPKVLTQFLYDNVPLAQAMQVSVMTVTPEQVVIEAPLAPNINQHGTVFGGSAATLAVLAAWSLLHTRLQSQGIACQLVVRGSSIEYKAPMQGLFSATASAPAQSEWDRFVERVRTHGKARVTVTSVLSCAGLDAAIFQGSFVALASLPDAKITNSRVNT